MRTSIPFALNHMSAPGLDCRSFIDLAAGLDCLGVELRNDLSDKKLSDRPFFDGEDPATIGAYARERGIRILGLSEAYGFNNWNPQMAEKVRLLIAQAATSGAESISLIPRNDAPVQTASARAGNLRTALAAILPMIADAGIIALIEPLGFTTSSLRYKREAVEAIEAVGGEKSFRLVHDTFHHHLAEEVEYFPEYTGIVHISGVVDPALAVDEMRDEHRTLVDDRDRLGNVAQIRTLIGLGYEGAFSFEPFSPVVHALSDPVAEFRRSFDHIRSAASWSL
ncbi:TIM barrel protein [Rhizobiaceae bacterium n13]|uniref:TIM barrel protein n=1 Tax=Ferirhizobium litorale TaxID=2927786 RepID=A0AAE3U0I2_9HYPH|nr:TIM barrel protein [Fererhizobium litorale]MDI7861569.1 TIM barrel protein [Fererhizobium litorale]MDI7922089.1 TIM barrel protein [Fererhizobium litorale]